MANADSFVVSKPRQLFGYAVVRPQNLDNGPRDRVNDVARRKGSRTQNQVGNAIPRKLDNLSAGFRKRHKSELHAVDVLHVGTITGIAILVRRDEGNCAHVQIDAEENLQETM
jgi:hypothetical protein